MPLRALCVLFGVLLLALHSTPALAQEGADIIRGRVLGPDSSAVYGAIITATSVSGNVSRRARSARDGRYTIVFPGGDGDYFVLVQALGFAPRRFQLKRTADQDILVADAILNYAAQGLDTVQIAGERNRVNRNTNPADISGSERGVDASALGAEQQGDLAAHDFTAPDRGPEFRAMTADRRQFQGCDSCIDVLERPAADQRERAAGAVQERRERFPQALMYMYGPRRRREVEQRAVDVEQDRVLFRDKTFGETIGGLR